MGVVLALPATGRDGQSTGQAIKGAGAVLDGVFDITLGDVIADADVHGNRNGSTNENYLQHRARPHGSDHGGVGPVAPLHLGLLVVLEPHAVDQVELRFKPVNVLFLALEDGLE